MANGTLKVQNIETSSGSGTITLGQSGETLALGASNISGFGKIAQVVHNDDIDTFNTTSSSLVDTNYSISITPTKSTSKIIVAFYGNFAIGGASGRGAMAITSNSSGSTQTLESSTDYAFWNGSSTGLGYMGSFIGVEDNIGTTNEVTYKLQIKRISASVTVYAPIDANNAHIIAYEVLA